MRSSAIWFPPSLRGPPRVKRVSSLSMLLVPPVDVFGRVLRRAPGAADSFQFMRGRAPQLVPIFQSCDRAHHGAARTFILFFPVHAHAPLERHRLAESHD